MDFDDDDDGLFETVDLVEEEDEPLPKPGPSSGGTEGSLTFKGLGLLGAVSTPSSPDVSSFLSSSENKARGRKPLNGAASAQ